MAEIEKKMAVFLLMVSAMSVGAHDSRYDNSRSSASAEKSEELEREHIARRLQAEEWQYEGLPIEFPSRRLSGGLTTTNTTTTNSTTTATPTTKRMYPPLDPRYRRIYSADESTTIEEHPYMAALLVNRQLWCGAVVIEMDRVLTAAHCLQLQYNNRFFREYVKMLTVRVGSSNVSSGGEVLRVSEIFFHPNYKPDNLEFNVAVLRLHKNMTIGSKDPRVDKINFSWDKNVPIDKEVSFLGWGSVLGAGGDGGQVLLQKLQLPIYDLADCQEVYGRDLVTRNNFCAGYITKNKNVCNHDAGGPAIMDGILMGILSFSSKRCDKPDQPAVFTSVGAVAPWLSGLSERGPVARLRGIY